MRWAALVALVALPTFAQTEVPSGLQVTPLDVIEEEQPGGETWLVLRYLAPSIEGGAVAYEDVVEDLQALCDSEGIRLADDPAKGITQIVVVLLDQPVKRGEVATQATQYIGAYLPTEEGCSWNDF